MANIIDLSIFGGIEPLEFKGLDGELYTIPSTLSTQFVIRFSKYTDDIKKLKGNDEKAFKLMKELVVDILNLDKTKNVDLDHVNKYFDDVRIMKIIIEKTMEHVKQIANDPN